MATTRKNLRPDHTGTHASEYAKNKQKILKTQDICAICGKPVDKSLKFPNPYSASIDHIIPIDKGGHPSDMKNLALTHLRCNRLKSDNLPTRQVVIKPKRTHLMDWS